MIFLIIIFTTIFYIVLTIRYFSFFLNVINTLILIILLIFLCATLMLYLNNEVSLLAISLQMGIFASLRIHSNLFYLESPTLFLSKIIQSTKKPNIKNIRKSFLKHSFIDYYLKILTKEKFLKKDKNYFEINKKGIIFFKFYEKLFNIFIK